jgi:hypothetical protein
MPVARKNVLELRFDQQEIYMKLSERVIWLCPFERSRLRESTDLNSKWKCREDRTVYKNVYSSVG